jgi:cell division inhibitor SulA
MEQLSLDAPYQTHPTWTAERPPLTEAGRYTDKARSAEFADPERHADTGNVTEIILPQGQVENFQLLLPMLTQLNQEERWLAWIDPPASLVQKWQQHHGIVPGQLLVLRSSEQHDALEMAERALAAGTCHAVVLWSGKLSKSAHDRLEKASAKGQSHGVVLRKR